MSKSPTENAPPFRPEPNRAHPPNDEKVKLPHQVRISAARAEELIAGRPPHCLVARHKTRSEPSIPYSDAQIDEVLERWERGDLKVSDPDFGIIVELAREGARLTKAHRKGAGRPRKTSTEVRRRLECLVQAFRELPPKFRAHHTGKMTIERLRAAVIRKLGLPDDDEVVSEDTIRQDIRQVRPILRLIQNGVIPPTGKPNRQGPSESTCREIEAGRAALARIAANKSPEPKP
jgi:hypothetical protein